MISPELLRRYPFFALLDDPHQKAIAMITDEVSFANREVIFKENQPAQALYLLLEGSIDLYFTVEEEYRPELRKEFVVGEINPGEPFAISALIEPYVLTSSARAANASRVLKIDAAALRALCEVDCRLGYTLMKHAAKAALERLHFTHVQLAAAR
ncbi:MAG: cyclic nucleotide-binding domain-containing protein [Anaerolineae bacterium]|nr:cyclic nucleotide-binding domain-containing protein [Anaerolineae bacterium]